MHPRTPSHRSKNTKPQRSLGLRLVWLPLFTILALTITIGTIQLMLFRLPISALMGLSGWTGWKLGSAKPVSSL